MNNLTVLDGWLVVLGLGLGTFLIRYSFIGLFANRDMPHWLTHGLKLTVPAIFASIVAGSLFLVGGQLGGWTLWPRYLAAVVALLVALRTQGHVLRTVLSGMAALHLLLWIQRSW